MSVTLSSQVAGRVFMVVGLGGVFYSLFAFPSPTETPAILAVLQRQRNMLLAYAIFAFVGAALYMAGITAAVKAGETHSESTAAAEPHDDQLSWKRDGRAFLHPFIVAAVGVVILWILSAGAIYAWFGGWETRGQVGDLFGAVNALFSGLAFAGVSIALVLQAHSLRLQRKELHDAQLWNRAKASQDLVVECTLGQFGNMRRRFERIGVDIYDDQQTSANVNLTADKKRELDAILNYLETICISMDQKVLDEKIVWAAFASILPAYRRWAAPYIVECRKVRHTFWQPIDGVVAAWEMVSAEASPKQSEDALLSKCKTPPATSA